MYGECILLPHILLVLVIKKFASSCKIIVNSKLKSCQVARSPGEISNSAMCDLLLLLLLLLLSDFLEGRGSKNFIMCNLSTEPAVSQLSHVLIALVCMKQCLCL